MKRTQRGITLVALIITIVVLLILAMAGIGAVRDSKIIAHAQNAASLYNQAKANEIDALKGFEELMKLPEKPRAYGTEEAYALEIGNTLTFVFNTDGTYVYVTTIKERDTYLSGLTAEDRAAMEEQIEILETTYKSKVTGVIILNGEDGEQPIGVHLGDKVMFGEGGILEYNESLTGKLARDKSSYTCYKMDLFGIETIIGIDFKNNKIDTAAYQNGLCTTFAKFDAKTGKTENKITVELYGGEPGEKVEVPAGSEYIYYEAKEGDDATCYIKVDDVVIYVNGIPTGDGSGFKATKANETDILKLGVYYK